MACLSANHHAYQKRCQITPSPRPSHQRSWMIIISLLAKCLVHRPQRKTDYLPRSRRRFTLKHVKNANLMLICEECSLWRLLYSCTKLSAEEQRKIQDKLADAFFYMQVTYWRSGWWLTSVYENLELLRTGWKAIQCWVRSDLCVLWFYQQLECARLLPPSTVCPLFRQREN